jgi:hypothetical protein
VRQFFLTAHLVAGGAAPGLRPASSSAMILSVISV